MKNFFLGHQPSHFQMNYVVRAFILSESFLWSGFNFVFPLLSIFVVQKVKGGTIASAATGVSIYMIIRVITELLTGRILEQTNDKRRLMITILGLFIVSMSFLGYYLVQNLMEFYFVQVLIGFGLGIASPPKNSLFARHLDKNKETTEWSIYDGLTFIGMSLATALGGFLTQVYGFHILFIAAFIFGILSIIPYLVIYSEIN